MCQRVGRYCAVCRTLRYQRCQRQRGCITRVLLRAGTAIKSLSLCGRTSARSRSPRRAEYKRDGAGKVGINSVNIKEFAQRMELEQQACPKQTRALALALALWPDYTSVISLERLLAAGVC